MSGLAVGLVLGTGLFLMWSACWVRPARSIRARRRSSWSKVAQDARLVGVRPRTLGAACLLCGALVLAVLQVVTGVLPVAACFGVMAATAPLAVVRGRASRRRSGLREIWPEAVDNLGSAVRAGLSLPEALSQLSVRGPAPLRPAFAAFAQDYRASGRLHEALDALKDRLADPVGDRVVESLRIAREVGGSDLGRLLRTLSAFLRQDARTRSELEARQGWTVNGARLAVAAPWIVLLLLATRPESIAAYSRPAGAVVLAGGALVSVVSYLAMLRIARLPAEERVLQ
ncbi:type II secretion system F family protein [Angustibacter sp. McL0619]|uniref:type II secretion system F family protein n=1 Tax=Angustibacter sp. McL0619 TaxID=3415676 RepID=UPI003CF98144